MTTGEKIRELRKALGLTQEELGRLIGVQKAAINKYETGVVVNLKRATMIALAKALHVSPLELFDDDNSKPLPPGPRASISSSEAYIISGGVDNMPPEKRKQALQIMQVAFPEYSDLFSEPDKG